MPSTRRAFLRRAGLGGAVGLGGLAGLAGCSALPPASSPKPMLAERAPPPTVGADGWPAPRADPRNSGHPGAVGPGNAPGRSWRRSVGDGVLFRAPPVVDGDDLFVLDDRGGVLYCLAVRDGGTRWTASVGFQDDAVAPTVTADAVYAPAGQTLRRLDRGGTEDWRVDFPGAVRGVTVGGDALFVATADGDPGVYALDPATGERRWALETGLVVAPPAYADGRVVAGDMRGVVRCLDARTGDVRWDAEVPDAWVQAAPLVVDRTAFVGSGTTDLASGHLAAYDVVNGTELWTVDVDAAVLSSFAGAGRRLFVADADGTLRRLGTDFPRIDWTFSPLGPFEDGVSNVSLDFAPALANGLVAYAGPDERVYVVETDAGDDGGADDDADSGEEGESVPARFVADVEATSPPTVAGDALFVGTTEGVLAIGRREVD